MTKMLTPSNGHQEAILPSYLASASAAETPPPYPTRPDETFAGSSRYIELQELRRTELDRKTEPTVDPQPARNTQPARDIEAQRPRRAADPVPVAAANVQEQRRGPGPTFLAFTIMTVTSTELVTHHVAYYLRKPAAEVCGKRIAYPKDSARRVPLSFLIWLMVWSLLFFFLGVGWGYHVKGLPQGREREAARRQAGRVLMLWLVWGIAMILYISVSSMVKCGVD